MGRSERKAKEHRVARVRLLSDELDRLRLSAVERTRSIDTKASFVVVAAGVIATAAFDGLSDSRVWWIGLIAVILTVATVIVAAIALWPAKLESASGRAMVTEWVADTDMTPVTLEDSLLEVKALEIENRDRKNESRARATKWAFGLLVASLVAALSTAAVGAATPEGETSNGETVDTPAPTSAPFESP